MKMKDIPDNILKIGDPRLREQSTDANESYGTVLIIKEMLETMDACEPGSVAGLAAPQIGYNKNIIIAYINKKRTIMINTKILEMGTDLSTMYEACLSVPGESGLVTRPTYIKVTYLTPEFESVTVDLYGWNARVVLHEYGHTIGVLYTDLVEQI
jgi:peptide deformylase